MQGINHAADVGLKISAGANEKGNQKMSGVTRSSDLDALNSDS
jgi:hypothetical protein